MGWLMAPILVQTTSIQLTHVPRNASFLVEPPGQNYGLPKTKLQAHTIILSGFHSSFSFQSLPLSIPCVPSHSSLPSVNEHPYGMKLTKSPTTHLNISISLPSSLQPLPSLSPRNHSPPPNRCKCPLGPRIISEYTEMMAIAEDLQLPVVNKVREMRHRGCILSSHNKYPMHCILLCQRVCRFLQLTWH
jgi:hypothetical protein